MSLSRLVGVAAVVVCAGIASATVTKIAAFHPWGVGLTENPGVDGTGTLRHVSALPSNPANYTRVHLEVSGLLPNTGYSVALENDILGGRIAQTVVQGTLTFVVFTTDPLGDGVFTSNDTDFQDDWTQGNPRITIFLWDPNADPSPSPSRDDLDAAGESRAISELR